MDAGHEGPGSKWAKSVKAGDVFQYAGCGSSPQAPAPLSRMVFLGDESSVGYFLGLQQLLPTPYPARISGAITFSEAVHRRNFTDYLRLPLDPLCDREGAPAALEGWLGGVNCTDADTVFYVMGNMEMVQSVRRTLKEKGVDRKDIKLQGFWK
jgi:NADPH-dependent ferric siderophore reductase